MGHVTSKTFILFIFTFLSISISNAGFISINDYEEGDVKLITLGNIFIDDDYFFAHIDEGIKLHSFKGVEFIGESTRQRTQRKIDRALNKNITELDESGLYVTDRFIFRDYFVTSLFEDHISKAFAFKNIFIMDLDPFIPNTAPATQVPIPAAGLFFFTSLFTLWSIRRGKRK